MIQPECISPCFPNGPESLLEQYPWYFVPVFNLPVPAAESLQKLVTLDDRFWAEQKDFPPYIFDQTRNPLIKLCNPPTIQELKVLLTCKLEYGIVHLSGKWLTIVGTTDAVPFSGRCFPPEGIFIHNHRRGFPYPSGFDLDQENGRHLLVSDLGLIEYPVYPYGESTVLYSSAVGPRFVALKQRKDLLYQRGLIKQKIPWSKLNNCNFSEILGLAP